MNGSVVAVFGSSTLEPHDDGYGEAVRLGRLLADEGATVATGGYGGTMEAVSRGANEGGTQVIGVTAPGVFPGRTRHNEWVTREVTADTISERIHRLVDLADGFIALPGSLGTATELLVAWNDAYVAPMAGRKPKPLVVVGAAWAGLVAAIADTTGADDSLVRRADNAASALEELRQILMDGQDQHRGIG